MVAEEARISNPAHADNQKALRSKHIQKLPRHIQVPFNEINVGELKAEARNICVATAVLPNMAVAIEATPENLSYMKVAMQASKTDEPEEAPRKRPLHSERLSSTTGVRGVYRKSAKRLCFRYQNSDGLYKEKSMKAPASGSVEDLKGASERLRAVANGEECSESEASDDGGAGGHSSAESANDKNLVDAVSGNGVEDAVAGNVAESSVTGDERVNTEVVTTAEVSVAVSGLGSKWRHIFK